MPRSRRLSGVLHWGMLCCALIATYATAAPLPKHLIFWKGNFASAREAAKTFHKPILLHFSSDNPFDQQFDTVVYRDPDVILFTGHTCLPFLVHGEDGDSETVALCQSFHVKDFPTVLLLNSSGVEVDRMVGLQTPKQFLLYLQDFLNDTNTIGNYRKRLQADTTNMEVAYRLAVRYELRAEVDSAMWLMQEVIRRGEAKSIFVQSAELHVAIYESRALGKSKLLTDFFFGTATDSLRRGAAEELIGFYERHKIVDSIHVMYDRSIARWPRDGALYNNYAWFISQLPDGDLSKASALAIKAISLEPSNVNYLDTRAEVFGRQHLYKEAAATIGKALKIKPHDAALLARKKEFMDLMKPEAHSK